MTYNYLHKFYVVLYLIAISHSYTEAIQAEQKITISPTFAYRNYKEALPLPYKSNEYGLLQGLHIDYSNRHKASGWIYKISSEYLSGEVAYEGSTIGGRKYSDVTDSNIINAEFHSGKIIDTNIPYLLFSGLGYHYWSRGKCKNHHNDYSEIYRWPYVIFGTTLYVISKTAFSVDLTAKLMYPLNPRMKISASDSSYHLKSKTHYEVSQSINIKHLSLALYYRQVKLGESDYTIDRSYEPASSSQLWGARVGWNYNF